MTTIASQITSLTVVYSTVFSDADQSKHQSSTSLAFVWGIPRDRWIPRTKGQLCGKCFHLMTSSCFILVQSMKFYVQLTQLKSVNASIFPIYALLSTLPFHHFELSLLSLSSLLSLLSHYHWSSYVNLYIQVSLSHFDISGTIVAAEVPYPTLSLTWLRC